MKEHALRYVQQWGWPVFPVTPGAKTPLTAHGFHDASTDPEQIEAWWTQWPDANIGVPTGAGTKVFVVDCDIKNDRPGRESFKELRLPKTLSSRTPTGGWHAFFWHPGKEIRNRTNLRPGIDIRGDGGYVVVPPSKVNGCHYKWLHEMKPVEAPQHLLKLLRGTNRTIRKISGNGGLKISEGGRNDHLARLGGALRSQGHSEGAIKVALIAENADRCDPPLGESEIRTIAASVASYDAPDSQDEPEPLRRSVPPPGEYPVAALGDVLGAAAQRIAEVVQAPLAVCGQTMLAAASLAAQAHADVLLDGRRELLSLWLISIAKSGERKSAADDIALDPHRVHERLAADQYRRDMAAHEVELATFDTQRRAAIKKRDPLDIEAVLRNLGASPDEPLKPWLLVSTPTIEGLHKLCKGGQPSLGLFHDDGGEFLGGHAMNAENRMKSAAGLSKWWDRGEFDRIRAGDGAEKFFGRRLAMHLMIQPVVAETILGDTMLCGQGFLARCLLAWPSTRIGNRKYMEADLSVDPALNQYRRIMAELLDRKPILRPETRNELEPRVLTLAPTAKRQWIILHDEIEAAQRDGAEYASISAWASKAPAQILRIAGVLTLVADSDASVIQAETIDQAAALAAYALDEAVRIVGYSHVPEETRHAQALLEWCHGAEITLLHSGAALRLGPNPIRTKAAFDIAVRELEKAGWAVPVAGGAEVDGKRRRRVWEIHP